jgi:hypothetical protein
VDTGGEQNTRLDRLESDIKETKDKLASLEKELVTLKKGHETMQSQLLGQDEKLDTILAWVTGAQKVAGVAAKHWKTALKFGCGVVTAWGITNPHVARTIEFVGKFFGI